MQNDDEFYRQEHEYVRNKPTGGSIKRTREENIDLFVGILVYSPLLISIGIITYQIYIWARYGFWQSVSFADSMTLLGFDLTPIYNPKDWIGIYEMLAKVFDLSSALVFFIVFCVSFTAWLRSQN